MNIAEIAKSAIEAQNAVNVSGLVLSWAKWMPVINADAMERNIEHNQHPVNVLMSDKIRSLILLGETDDLAFNAAYDQCQAIASQKNEPTKP